MTARHLKTSNGLPGGQPHGRQHLDRSPPDPSRRAHAARPQRSLISYLLRWEHHDAARRCLQQLLVTHSRLVSVYDNLARVYLARRGARPWRSCTAATP